MFGLKFWNQLLRRIYLEPYQSAKAKHRRDQDQWQVITAGDFCDIAEHDTRKKGAAWAAVFCAPAIEPGNFLATSMHTGKLMGQWKEIPS